MYYVYTHMQYGIFLSVKNASALLLRLASGDFCVCASACVDLPLCQYVRTHVYTGSEYLQQSAATCCCFFCVSSVSTLCIWLCLGHRRLAILTAFADLFR